MASGEGEPVSLFDPAETMPESDPPEASAPGPARRGEAIAVSGELAAAVPGAVLANRYGYRITATGLKVGYSGLELGVEIESNRLKPMEVSVWHCYVNGCEVRASLSAAADPGQKVAAVASIPAQALRDFGISHVVSLEVAFWISANGNFHETRPCVLGSLIAGAPGVSPTGAVVYEDDLVRGLFLSADCDAMDVRYLVENKCGESIRMSVRGISAGGIKGASSMNCYVTAGHADDIVLHVLRPSLRSHGWATFPDLKGRLVIERGFDSQNTGSD